jgi:hypothetical protein
MTQLARSLAAAALVALAGCGGGNNGREAQGTETGTTAAAPDTAASKEFKVASVMIGKRIGESKMVTEPTFQFAPGDTIYASVSTTGARESAELRAVWRFQTGQTVDSSSQTISPQGDENTEFHVSNPKGWPVGTYNVTVYANGDSVDSKNFVVKK